MASSSTNKQPCLIDRPLFNVIPAGGAAALAVAGDLRTPAPAGLSELVFTGTDGCFIDSVTVLTPVTGLPSSRVVLFASRVTAISSLNASNCFPIGWVDVNRDAVGARAHIPLLPLTVPVPNLASPAATTVGYPGEIDKKNTGLMLPSDWQVYAGTDVTLGSARVLVIAQGGYY
jgi:hypothetical protein